MATRVVQLDLNQNPWAFKARSLLSLSDRLLSAIADHVPDAETTSASGLRGQIDHWRRALQIEDDPDSLALLAKTVATDCLVLLDQARQARVDRDDEVAALTELVQKVLGTLKGQAQTYEAEFAQSTTKIEKMVALEDIRELKHQLSREVTQLKDSARRRQQADEKRFDHLTSRVQALEISLQQARVEAATDALTGVLNRGAFEITLRTWLAKGSEQRGFSLALADLDDFKAINDAHGHQIGDRVLVAAAVHLRTTLKDGDLLFRYGGEEFALLYASTSADDARDRLTAALKAIAPAYEYDDGTRTLHVSFAFSAGVTAFAEGDSYDSLVHRADEALYDAKRRGKRRVETRSRSRLRSLWN